MRQQSSLRTNNENKGNFTITNFVWILPENPSYHHPGGLWSKRQARLSLHITPCKSHILSKRPKSEVPKRQNNPTPEDTQPKGSWGSKQRWDWSQGPRREPSPSVRYSLRKGVRGKGLQLPKSGLRRAAAAPAGIAASLESRGWRC